MLSINSCKHNSNILLCSILFCTVLNLRPIQKHRHHHAALIYLDMIQCPQHQISIQLLYGLCMFRQFHKIHRPKPHQQILSLCFLFPLRQKRIPAFQQLIPCHEINLPHGIFIYMPIGASQHAFHLIPLTALPDPARLSRTALPTFPMENFTALTANNFRCKWILLRIVGKGICPMLFQIPLPAFHLQLHAFPNPWLNDGFMVILNIKLLNLPFVHHTLFCQKVCRITFLQKGIPFIFFICLCQDLHKKIIIFLYFLSK